MSARLHRIISNLLFCALEVLQACVHSPALTLAGAVGVFARRRFVLSHRTPGHVLASKKAIFARSLHSLIYVAITVMALLFGFGTLIYGNDGQKKSRSIPLLTTLRSHGSPPQRRCH